MPHSTTEKREQGFSLLELMIVVSITFVLAAVAVPRIINIASDMRLRYTASDLSGLLQSARIQAVRKNASYTVIQGPILGGGTGFFVDLSPTRTGIDAIGDPRMPVPTGTVIHAGNGSGAPNEGAFLAGLAFTVNPGASQPSFNARGLPCIFVAAACPQVPNQGFVIFMSKPNLTGNAPWVAVVISPSGHVQVWSGDPTGTWVQRD
jgi:prepilin-type N-terminal cleavage/methylation domain-containing protein